MPQSAELVQESAKDGVLNENDAADMAVDGSAAADASLDLNRLRMAAPEACMSQWTRCNGMSPPSVDAAFQDRVVWGVCFSNNEDRKS